MASSIDSKLKEAFSYLHTTFPNLDDAHTGYIEGKYTNTFQNTYYSGIMSICTFVVFYIYYFKFN